MVIKPTTNQQNNDLISSKGYLPNNTECKKDNPYTVIIASAA